MDLMSIGEFAKRSRLSSKALRLYESAADCDFAAQSVRPDPLLLYIEAIKPSSDNDRSVSVREECTCEC